MKRKAGLIILAFVAIVMVGPSLIGPNKPMAGTCETSAAGIGLIANSLKQGTASSIAMTAAGTVLANQACKSFVESLEKNPTQEQPVRVTTPAGDVVEEQVSAEDLTREPPTAGEVSWDTGLGPLLACIESYDTAILREWCFDGQIQPLGQ